MLARSPRPVSEPTLTPPTIDPRLQARRREVQEQQWRRGRHRVLVGLAVTALLGGIFGLTRGSVLDIDQVAVSGVDRSGEAEILERAGIEIGSPMVDLDAGAVEQRLAGMAWVDQVSVARSWPATVEVTVTMRKPVAVDPNGAMVDAEGRVLGSDVPGSHGALPAVPVAFGQPGSVVDQHDRPVVEAIAAIPASLEGEVVEGRRVGSDVVLELRDGITVRIGDSTRLPAKFVAVEALLEQADRSTIDKIDVCQPGSPSLTRIPDDDPSLTSEPGKGA